MPLKELARLQRVNRFLKLESNKEQELQEIAELAAKICRSGTALIHLNDGVIFGDNLLFGTGINQAKKVRGLCELTVTQKNLLIINDLWKDSRFNMDEQQQTADDIRFFAGMPLNTLDGHNLGTLCIADESPKILENSQILILKMLSKQIVHVLELSASLEILKNQYIETKNSLNKLTAFFEASHSCHVFLGPNMEVVAFNKAFKLAVRFLFAKTVNVGDNIQAFVSKRDQSDFIYNFERAMAGKSISAEKQIIGTVGSSWWHITYDPARDEDGNIIGVSFNATDISARISQERKLDTQNLTLKQIGWVQSHEIRKPVSSILGLMEIIKEEGYRTNEEVLIKMESVVQELDEKIKRIVGRV